MVRFVGYDADNTTALVIDNYEVERWPNDDVPDWAVKVNQLMTKRLEMQLAGVPTIC